MAFLVETTLGKTIRTTGNHPYLTKEGWIKTSDLQAGIEIATANEINAHAFLSSYSDSQCTAKSTQKQECSTLQLWQSLVSLLPRINNYTPHEKDNAHYYETNTQHYWQFFKKVTGKSYRQDGLAHISKVLCNKFPAFLVNNYHLTPLMFGTTDKTVMNKHYQDDQAKRAKDTQHNNHCSPLSTVKIKNKIIKNPNIDQNIIFCDNNNFAKNSPAKYPARIIFAKSPIRFAIELLDFGLNHLISETETITKFIVCQADIFVGWKILLDITSAV